MLGSDSSFKLTSNKYDLNPHSIKIVISVIMTASRSKKKKKESKKNQSLKK